MYVIMGGTGHVGSATAQALLGAGKAVTIIARNSESAANIAAMGAEIAQVDVGDVASLRAVFQRGTRAFLLNPPGDTTKDSDELERRSASNILAALENSGLEKVVAESTAGAQSGMHIGDLSVLWEFEQGLAGLSVPAAINRAAYYMSNWDAQLGNVYATGVLTTMFPADLELPMIAPNDLGLFAAKRLLSSVSDIGIRAVEGPARYSSRQVADAFAAALQRDVRLSVTPYGQWENAFLKLGFSREAADSYARMTRVTIEQGFDKPDEAWRGVTTLEGYISGLVATFEPEKQNG